MSAMGALLFLFTWLVFAIVGARLAQASVVVGGEVAVPFAVDAGSRAAGPGMLGEAALRRSPDGGRSGFGLALGERRESFLSPFGGWPDRAELRGLFAGPSLHTALGPASWQAHAFVALGLGYARLSLDNEEMHLVRKGLYLSPQVGLRVPFRHFDLTTAVRYHHLYSPRALPVVDDWRTRHFAGMGLGVGLFIRL